MVDEAGMEPGRETTFDVNWFLGTRAGGSAATRRSYKQILAKVEGLLGRPLASASVRNLDDLKANLRKMRSGLQYVNVLRMFYGACVRASNDPEQRFRFEQLRDASVMKEKRPRMDPADVLEPSEINRLMAAALTLRDRALFGLLYETGCRISEALALDWSNITHEPATNGQPEMWIAWFPKMKVSGSEHQGFLIDTAPAFKAWAEARPPEAEAVFCTVSGRLTAGGAWRRVSGARERAGITKPVHPHSFRHARATHLLSAGWSEARVKQLLGWSPGSRMLDKYSHLTGQDVKRALLEAKGFTVPSETTPTFTYRPEAAMAPVKALAGLGQRSAYATIMTDIEVMKTRLDSMGNAIPGSTSSYTQMVDLLSQMVAVGARVLSSIPHESPKQDSASD
jgi:integrase